MQEQNRNLAESEREQNERRREIVAGDDYAIKQIFGTIECPRRPTDLLEEVVANPTGQLKTQAARDKWYTEWNNGGKDAWNGFSVLGQLLWQSTCSKVAV